MRLFNRRFFAVLIAIFSLGLSAPAFAVPGNTGGCGSEQTAVSLAQHYYDQAVEDLADEFLRHIGELGNLDRRLRRNEITRAQYDILVRDENTIYNYNLVILNAAVQRTAAALRVAQAALSDCIRRNLQ